MINVSLYFGLSKIPQTKVQSPQIVEDLRGNISLDLLLEDASGGAICRQSSLQKTFSVNQIVCRLSPNSTLTSVRTALIPECLFVPKSVQVQSTLPHHRNTAQ